MTTQSSQQIYAGIVLILVVALPAACAGTMQPCEVSDLLRLSTADLSKYEKIETALLGESAEGASVEYYYSSSGDLEAIQSVYYGETGKTVLKYYFGSPSTYTSKLTEYFYSAPIYVDGSEIVAINQSHMVVCEGKLVRGVGDELIGAYFDRVLSTLEHLRENAPK